MNKKLISLCMAGVMAVSALPTTVFAASIGSSSADPSIGEDTAQHVKTQYSTVRPSDAQTQVYLTVDDRDLVVSLPTTVVLSGTPDESGKYIGKYSVGVNGDMSGNKIVTVTPESSSVELKQKGKNNKTAKISQTQTVFTSDDFATNTKTNGTIAADKLTAGSWNSDFNFNIQYNGNKQFDNYTVLYRYDLSATNKDKVYAYYLVPNSNTETIQSNGTVSRAKKTRSRAKTQSTTNTTEIEYNGIKYTLSDSDKLVITGDGTIKSNIVNDLGDQAAIHNAIEQHFENKYPTTPKGQPTIEEWNNMSENERRNLYWYSWSWNNGIPTLIKYNYIRYYKTSNGEWTPFNESMGGHYENVDGKNSKVGINSYNGILGNEEIKEITEYQNSIASQYSISCPKTIVLEDNITKIGNKAFAGITTLEHVQLSQNLKEIGNNAFYGCSNLQNVAFPEGLEKIGEYAFQNCLTIKDVTLPTSLTYIGYSAFQNCTNLHYFDFNNCKITTIPSNMLKDTIVYSVDIPSTVINIQNNAFPYTLKHVEIPNGVTSIGSFAMENAEEVYLPKSVKELGLCALKNVPVVYVSNSNISLGDSSIMGNKDGKIYCVDQATADKVTALKDTYDASGRENHSQVIIKSEFFNNKCSVSDHEYELTRVNSCGDYDTYSDDIATMYTCKVCGYEKYEIPPKEHLYKTEIVKKATCTESGTEKYTCVHCGQWNTTYIPPTGHHIVDGVCVNCGERVENSYDISASQDGSLTLTCDNDQNYTISGTGTLSYNWWTALLDPDKYVAKLNEFADDEEFNSSEMLFVNRTKMNEFKEYINNGGDVSDLSVVMKKFNIITWDEYKSLNISNEQFLKEYTILTSYPSDFKDCANVYLDTNIIKSFKIIGDNIKIGSESFDFCDMNIIYYLGNGVTYIASDAFARYGLTNTIYCQTQKIANLITDDYSNNKIIVDASKF